MRLNDRERNVIVNSIRSIDPEAVIYLFGSRTDENAKGGDIDLLIYSKSMNYRDRRKIRAEVFKYLAEQRIDIVITDNLNKPFFKLALKQSEQLWPKN